MYYTSNLIGAGFGIACQPPVRKGCDITNPLQQSRWCNSHTMVNSKKTEHLMSIGYECDYAQSYVDGE